MVLKCKRGAAWILGWWMLLTTHRIFISLNNFPLWDFEDKRQRGKWRLKRGLGRRGENRTLEIINVLKWLDWENKIRDWSFPIWSQQTLSFMEQTMRPFIDSLLSSCQSNLSIPCTVKSVLDQILSYTGGRTHALASSWWYSGRGSIYRKGLLQFVEVKKTM